MTNSTEPKPATQHTSYGYDLELHEERPMSSDSPFFDHADRQTVLYLRPDFETVLDLPSGKGYVPTGARRSTS